MLQFMTSASELQAKRNQHPPITAFWTALGIWMDLGHGTKQLLGERGVLEPTHAQSPTS